MNDRSSAKPVLLVLASTYPRWSGDPEPAFVHELSRRLLDSFDVIALCPHANGAEHSQKMDGVDIIRYRYAPKNLQTLVNDGGITTNLRRNKWKILLVPGFILAQAWHIWRICRKHNVQVIHAHWIIPQGLVMAGLHCLPGFKTPFLVTSHGADLYALKGFLFQALRRFVMHKAAAVTVVSSAMRDVVLHEVNPSKVGVAPMGIDMTHRFVPDVAVTRSSHEILFVGRLVEKKGLSYLIQAMPAILEQVPQACLTIAGFGPEEKALKEKSEQLGLASKISFIGAIPSVDLPAHYQRAAIFVAPFIQARSGDQEGLGLVLVEAIACGCPILAGDVPALQEILDSRFTEMVIDPFDVPGMAASVIKALENPEMARSRAEKLRLAIGARFDWENVSMGYANQLKKMSS